MERLTISFDGRLIQERLRRERVIGHQAERYHWPNGSSNGFAMTLPGRPVWILRDQP
jgi:hypothetical protein